MCQLVQTVKNNMVYKIIMNLYDIIYIVYMIKVVAALIENENGQVSSYIYLDKMMKF